MHIYKGCLKEANLLRGISLDLSGKGVDLEDLSFATRVPIHLCGNGRGIRSSLSLSLSGLLRNRFRIGYVHTPRGFLLRPNDLKGLDLSNYGTVLIGKMVRCG